MKTKMLGTLVLMLSAILIYGCASIAPNMVSTEVYSSSRDSIVAKNLAITAQANNAKENEKMSLETAKLWNELAKKEIGDKLNPHQGGQEGLNKDTKQATSKTYTIGHDGVVGGLPCLFGNDSQRNKTLILTKDGGLLSGYKFKFDVVKQGGQRKYNLLPGIYHVAWTVEYDNNIYAGKPMEVTLNPKLYDDRNGEQFHGGYSLWGY